MTREEAVNELNDRIKSAEYVDSDYIDCVSVDAVKIAISALSVPETNVGDTINRQAAIDALWKALYEYEDKTEKQFIESDDLDIEEWILHRIFVQNMSDIDRKAILDLPSAQPDVPERNVGKWIKVGDNSYMCSVCGEVSCCNGNFCPDCGVDMRERGTDDCN